MPTRKRTPENEYQEIQHIREDINSLKSNVVALTRHLRENGESQLIGLEQRAEDRLRNVQTRYKDSVEQFENRVRERPGQSVTMAFCAGILASYLIGRR